MLGAKTCSSLGCQGQDQSGGARASASLGMLLVTPVTNNDFGRLDPAQREDYAERDYQEFMKTFNVVKKRVKEFEEILKRDRGADG